MGDLRHYNQLCPRCGIDLTGGYWPQHYDHDYHMFVCESCTSLDQRIVLAPATPVEPGPCLIENSYDDYPLVFHKGVALVFQEGALYDHLQLAKDSSLRGGTTAVVYNRRDSTQKVTYLEVRRHFRQCVHPKVTHACPTNRVRVFTKYEIVSKTA